MARKLIVEVLLDSAAYSRQVKKTQAETTALAADLKNIGRHTATAAVGFKGLGRSLALMTGGFVAFEGVSQFLGDSVKFAQDAAVSQRQLAAQMKTSGESFADSRKRIEEAGLSLSRFGFTSEDSAHALTVLDRGTRSISESIRLQGLAADIARAKNIDLAAAANVVAKVFGGQETALRRAVPGLSKTAHGMDLIRQAQQRLAGQAAAATTPSERFNATLHETERIVGTALLPTLNRYLTQLSVWLDKMNRSGQLQRDVNQAIKQAVPLVDDLAKAFTGLAGAIGGAVRLWNQLPHLKGRPSTPSLADLTQQMFGFHPGYGTNLFAPVYGPPRPSAARPATAAAAAAAAAGRPALSAAQLRAIGLAGTPSLAALQAQRGYDVSAIEFLNRRFDQGRVSAKNYTDQMINLRNNLASVTAQIRAMAKEQQKAAEQHKKAVGIPGRVSGSYDFLQTSYQLPPRLELAQARADALGLNLRPILIRMRDAAYRALRSGHLAIQAQTDAWNAITQINDQLKNSARKAAAAQRRQAMQLAGASGAEYQFATARGGPTIHIEHFYSSAASPRALEEEIARRARARAHVRRGAR
jgi:hypothetical protein